VVIKVNQLNAYDKIGYTVKCPKWCIAFKYPATSVPEIKTVSKFATGVITPVLPT